MTENTDTPTLDIDLDDLERTARAATPGIWEVDRNTPFSDDIMGIFQPDYRRYVVHLDGSFHRDARPVSDEDAEYIAAARPEVVLELIRRLRAAEKAVAF